MQQHQQHKEARTAIYNGEPAGNNDVRLHSQPDWSAHSPVPVRLHSLRTNTYSPNNTTTRTAPTTRPTTWRLPALIQPLARRRQPANKIIAVQPRDLDILLAVWRYRFLTSHQIHQLFQQQFPSARTLRAHLASLTRQGYLGICPVMNVAPNFPHIYRTSRQGLRRVQQHFAEQGRVWQIPDAVEPNKERGMPLVSIMHEILTSQVDLAINQTVNNRSELNIAWHERRFAWKNRGLPVTDNNGNSRRLEPDSAHLIDMSGQTPLLLFIELDYNSNTRPRRLLDKLRRYDAWLNSPHAKNYLRQLAKKTNNNAIPSPLLLWVIAHPNPEHDEPRIGEILLQSLQLPKTTRERLWFTSAQLLAKHEHDPEPLAAPIWWRARHARTWLNAYREYVATLPSQARFADPYKLRFIRDKLKTMPHRPLFPPLQSS